MKKRRKGVGSFFFIFSTFRLFIVHYFPFLTIFNQESEEKGSVPFSSLWVLEGGDF